MSRAGFARDAAATLKALSVALVCVPHQAPRIVSAYNDLTLAIGVPASMISPPAQPGDGGRVGAMKVGDLVAWLDDAAWRTWAVPRYALAVARHADTLRAARRIAAAAT